MTKCEACKADLVCELVDGSSVCDVCPRWMLECEARYLLKQSLAVRRKGLDARVRKRSQQAVDELKAVMMALHKRRDKRKVCDD